MKILIVANSNPGDFSPFVTEQSAALRDAGEDVSMFGIVGKGIPGYLKNLTGIRRVIREYRPDLIHAHYGLSGLCANLQRTVPVVTTYHGSDIHSGGWILKMSQMAMRLSAYNVFVSEKLQKRSGYTKSNVCVLPCGIDLSAIKDIPKLEAKKLSGHDKPFVLFAGSFANDIKNYPLAKEAMRHVSGADLVELQGYSRQEVSLLMNAADCLLLTSHREGSPQVIKEAMACGTPIVSVDVGDVKDIIGSTAGCFIAEKKAEDIAAKIHKALAFHDKTDGRRRIIEMGLDNTSVAKKLVGIYREVLSKTGHKSI